MGHIHCRPEQTTYSGMTLRLSGDSPPDALSSRNSSIFSTQDQTFQKSAPHTEAKKPAKPSGCFLCLGQQHSLFLCPVFKEWGMSKRFGYVKANHICRNCLSNGHTTKDCPSQKLCQECGQKYTTLIHCMSGPSQKTPGCCFL